MSSPQNTVRRSYTLTADVSNAFSCAAFSENSAESLLVTGSSNCSVTLWNPSVSEKDAVTVFTGHQSVVECIALSNDDSKLAAGGASGALKIWDIVKNQFLTTFTGHHANVSCLIFNPMDRQILASGSMDATAKLWDIRSSTKKHILNLKGHNKKICCLDFSPDGKWLVTGSEDCTIMIWDLIAGGKLLMKISGHSGAVATCRFHPNEYLLATGSSDKTVRFFDLETAECVGQSENDSQAIQQIMFHPSGACLFAASKSNLKILGWEPIRLFDVLPLLADDTAPDLVQPNMAVGPLAYCQNTIFASYFTNRGAKFHIRKFSEQNLKPFLSNNNTILSENLSNLSLNHAPKNDQSFFRDEQSTSSSQSDSSPSLTNSGGRMRRSFYKKNSPDFSLVDERKKKIFPVAADSLATTSDEESTSCSLAEALTTTSTDLSSSSAAAAIVVAANLKKTPSREDLKFDVRNDSKTTMTTTTPFQPRRTLKRSPPRNPLPSKDDEKIVNRPSDFPVKIVEEKDKKRPYQRAKATVKPLRPQQPVSDLSPDASSADLTINNFGIQSQRPWNLKICAEEFLPSKEVIPFSPSATLPPPFPSSTNGNVVAVVSEDECLQLIEKQASSVQAVLQNRTRSTALIFSIWKSQGLKRALDTTINMNNTAVLIDLLNVMNFRTNLWSLDVCVLILPQIQELLQSKYPPYVQTSAEALRLMLKDFGRVIKDGLKIVPSIGVDITQEERYNKCQKCYVELLSIRNFVQTTMKNDRTTSRDKISVVNNQQCCSPMSSHLQREICLLLQQVVES